jgi:hypothetical protein
MGNREYFKGLWIDSSGYDFKKYPVVRFDMLGECDSTDALKNNIAEKLRREAERNGLNECPNSTLDGMLQWMVYTLKRATGRRVAILVDDYDAPVRGVINDSHQADKNWDTLLGFYSSLKSLADTDETHTVFVTGTIQFALTSLCGSLNNLDDLSLDEDYNAVCGFTVEEFESYFSDYLPNILEYNIAEGFLPKEATLSDLKKAIFDFYDGYSWDGKERILNPYSILKMIDYQRLGSYWFDNGTPTFFFDLFKRKNKLNFPDDTHLYHNSINLQYIDLELTTLMFQTGYLTIEKHTGPGEYLLRRPNKEVNDGLNESFLKSFLKRDDESISLLRERVLKALESFDAPGLAACFRDILLWNSHVELRAMEGSYLSLLGLVLKALQFSVAVQREESWGFMDMLITLGKDVAFGCGFMYKRLETDIEINSLKHIEEKRQKLLNYGIKEAKDQIALWRYDDNYAQEYRKVKKMAVAVVGSTDGAVVGTTDVAVEIY